MGWQRFSLDYFALPEEMCSAGDVTHLIPWRIVHAKQHDPGRRDDGPTARQGKKANQPWSEWA